MTNDEAIKEFQSELRWAELDTYPYISKKKVEADKMAIKALKQESVLDKIKVEINELSNVNPSYWHNGDMVDRDDVLQIIDKYKESEVQDADCD